MTNNIAIVDSISYKDNIISIQLSSCKFIPKAKTCIYQNGDLIIELLVDSLLNDDNICKLHIYLSSLPIKNINNIYLKLSNNNFIKID